MAPLLDGLRVLDLSLWQPGHTATQLLADLGADVVKVEPPGGDRMRPLVDRFVNFNGRKRSVVLDLKDDADRDTLLALAAGTEVVVTNYRPGVAERLGIGFERLRQVNPSIVVCSISGFGQTGPLAGATGHDANYQAYAGAFTGRDGEEPVPSALLAGDQGSGLAAAFAILAAVLGARRTGEGEHIDVSIADLLASWVAPVGAVDPRREPPTGGAHGGGAPAMGTFRTADGQWVVLGVFSEDHLWDALCEALGLDHAGLTMAARAEAATSLRTELTVAIGRWEREPLVEALAARSVPIAPVLTRDQMLAHPHFRQRGVLVAGADGFLALGHPIRYAVHPALPPGPPPALDEHGPEIRKSKDLAT
jgi:crotonobetainyl-CoA:carnitine CoA-transferase CaiB-like acyl-CoA transferase